MPPIKKCIKNVCLIHKLNRVSKRQIIRNFTNQCKYAEAEQISFHAMRMLTALR